MVLLARGVIDRIGRLDPDLQAHSGTGGGNERCLDYFTRSA